MKNALKKIMVFSLSVMGVVFFVALSIGKNADKQESTTATPSQLDYDLIQTELNLAKTEKLYMVFNFRKMELQLKIKAAVVWNFHFDSSAVTKEGIESFTEKFIQSGRQYVRPISGKHLFAADKKTPDSVLAIVGQVVNVDPNLLQRELPERFQLKWGGGLYLDVRTNVDGKPKAPLKNVLVQVGQVLAKPLGESGLEITMQPEAALTLYRATFVGLPTMIYPVSR